MGERLNDKANDLQALLNLNANYTRSSAVHSGSGCLLMLPPICKSLSLSLHDGLSQACICDHSRCDLNDNTQTCCDCQNLVMSNSFSISSVRSCVVTWAVRFLVLLWYRRSGELLYTPCWYQLVTQCTGIIWSFCCTLVNLEHTGGAIGGRLKYSWKQPIIPNGYIRLSLALLN